jgi:hypothetical protein
MDLPPNCEGAHDVAFYEKVLREILDSEIEYDSICFKDASGTSNPNKIYQTIKMARKLVGDDFPVIIKLNAEDFLKPQMELDEMIYVSKLLEKQGIDGIEMSGGTLISKDFTPKFGVLFSQSYARMYSKNTNNRTIATTTTISHYHTFFAANKINLRLSLGTGLLYLNTKCLYNDYPVKDNIYGIPVKANFAVFYKLSDKLAINLNLDTHYGFLFYGDYTLLIDDPYYYKTFFYSANVGLRYTFGNKETLVGS